jgi:hypothetical protein
MKTIGWRLFVLLMVMGTLGVVDAKGQAVVQFKAGSAFVAGNTTFPSGTYTVLQEDPNDPQILVISDDGNTHRAEIQAEYISSETSRNKTEIIFQKYGNTLVLKEIWVAGQRTGYMLPTTHVEKTAAKAGKPTRQSVDATSK